MHRFHTDPHAGSAPETAGLTIHWASRYDLLSRFLGLGVDSRGSRMIVEMAKIMAGDKVLDVGCGTGALTLTAARQAGPAGAVMGIDASPQMIAVARQKAAHAGSGANFEVGLVERITYPEASFDVVISRLVIHHLPDDLKRLAFGEIFRVLKPGGRVFLADFAPPSNPILAHLAWPLSATG